MYQPEALDAAQLRLRMNFFGFGRISLALNFSQLSAWPLPETLKRKVSHLGLL
jgi:hypothetical protein